MNLSFSTNSEEDYFAEIYSDKVVTISMVITYFIGLVPTFGVMFIVWLEKSGQAGPYRTLINQLVSCNYQSVRIYFLLDKVVSIQGSMHDNLSFYLDDSLLLGW